MSNELTIRDLHKDLDVLRRTNNFGNAMISADLNRVNRSIIGSSMMLCSQLDELSMSNSMALSEVSSSLEDFSYKNQQSLGRIFSSVNDIQEEIQLSRRNSKELSGKIIKEVRYSQELSIENARKIENAIKDAERVINEQIQLATSKLQLGIENETEAINFVNAQLEELRKESKIHTSILSQINEGIHNPEIQKTNNGIEDYNLRFFKSAVQSFNAALSIRERLYLPHYYLGLIFSDHGDDNPLYDTNKAEKEITDSIMYMLPFKENDDVLSYLILAHRIYSRILRAENKLKEAVQELDKGVRLVDKNNDDYETKLMYVEDYVKCFNDMGEKEKALIYARFGFENDATYVSLLYDSELENLSEDFLRIIEDCSVNFSDLITDLISKEEDLEVITKVNELMTSEDSKTYLGRSKILKMLRGSRK